MSIVKDEKLGKDTYVLITTSVLDNGVNLTDINNIVVSDMSKVKCLQMIGRASIPSGQYLNYSRIESGQFNTSVVVFELPGDFYTFRITSGRPSTNLLFKTIQIRKWLS